MNMISRKMNGKNAVLLTAWFCFTILIAFFSFHRLTFLEFITTGHDNGTYIVVAQKGECHIVDFDAPYDFISGVSFRIGTFARDNNSTWGATVLEKESEKVVCKRIFEASAIADNQWHFIDFGKNVKIDRTKQYQVKIEAKKVSVDTALAFYTENNIPCVRIHGGNIDFWWLGFSFFCSLFALIALLRSFWLKNAGFSCFDDKIFVGMMIACAVFGLMFFFKNTTSFTDEQDNINGGLLIANGRVLYRDYVTQHTPFAYYLCSVFALLGAKSVEQFRLSYYVLEGILFCLLYIRHSESIGRIKMILLPIVEIIVVNIVVPCGAMILSDSIQGLCFIALLLEFFGYCRDGKIDWIRSVIVSACVWFSFGSAFVSAYSLVFVFCAVMIMEIKAFGKNVISLKGMLVRFSRILIALLIPLVVAIVYFLINHAFVEAIKQFYVFNRRVYTIYQPYGSNLWHPIFYAIKNFGNEMSNNLNTAASNNVLPSLLKLLVLSGSLALSLKRFLLTRKIAENLIPFVVMVISASRGYYDFHGIAAWNIAVLIIVLYGSEDCLKIPRKYIPVSVLVLFLLCSPFFSAVCDGGLRKQQQISDFESMVIETTQDGEGIFLDGWCCEPNYFLAKNRLPVNKTLYMLPWYMDWYESDTISELKNKRPRYAIFNENMECWGRRNFTRGVYEALKHDYIKKSPNFWERIDVVP